jgi:hypothetical protein
MRSSHSVQRMATDLWYASARAPAAGMTLLALMVLEMW